MHLTVARVRDDIHSAHTSVEITGVQFVERCGHTAVDITGVQFAKLVQQVKTIMQLGYAARLSTKTFYGAVHDYVQPSHEVGLTATSIATCNHDTTA